VSPALNSPRGPVFITVTGKQEPYIPQLDAVKDKVRDDFVLAKATELSQKRAVEVAGTLKAAKDFAAAAKAAGLEAKDTELLAREATIPDIGVSADVDKVAFALPVNGVSDPITANNTTVIVRVVERDDVTSEELADAKEAFKRDLMNERRGSFFSSYMTKAKEKMKITINDEVLQRVVGQQQ
jgi:peptidyl-prolyl cis-trans isomerase D